MSVNLSEVNYAAMLASAIVAWSIGGCQQGDSAQYSSVQDAPAQCCQQHGSTPRRGEQCCQQHDTVGDNNACCAQAAPQPPHGRQLPVTLATIDERDKTGIAHQKVCPVTDAELGSMGDPIKVLIGGQPLYLCCQGCVAKVKNAPETYLSKVSQSHQSQ